MKYGWMVGLWLAASVALAAERVVEPSEVEERDGVLYELGHSEPYTGDVVGLYASGVKNGETHYVSGLKEGISTTWFESGKPRLQSSYKAGKRDGKWVSWDDQGRVLFTRLYKDGEHLH